MSNTCLTLTLITFNLSISASSSAFQNQLCDHFVFAWQICFLSSPPLSSPSTIVMWVCSHANCVSIPHNPLNPAATHCPTAASPPWVILIITITRFYHPHPPKVNIVVIIIKINITTSITGKVQSDHFCPNPQPFLDPTPMHCFDRLLQNCSVASMVWNNARPLRSVAATLT